MTNAVVKCNDCTYSGFISSMKTGKEKGKNHVREFPEHTVIVYSSASYRGWGEYNHAKVESIYTITKDGVKRETKEWRR